MSAKRSRPWQGAADANGDADNTTVEGPADNGVSPDKPPGSSVKPEHCQLLEASAIPVAFAVELGVRSIEHPSELPASLRAHAGALPGVLFPWHGADGVDFQLRPDHPTEVDGKVGKYLQASGRQIVNILGEVDCATSVYLVEGTKQALAARAWAPSDVLVIGIPGCWNAMKDGLLLPAIADRIEDLPVTVIFDADLTSNPMVLAAAKRLQSALLLEGASSVCFVLILAEGKDKIGLDDLLAQRCEEKRSRVLARLVAGAVTELPNGVADQPTRRRDDDRPRLSTEDDRLYLIQDSIKVLLSRWDGRRLFNHGDVVCELKDGRTTALSRGHLLNVLAETAFYYKPTRQGDVPAWPDNNVVLAVAARASEFTPLDRVTRSPFVRLDGTICQTPGYDKASRTFLVTDPLLEGVNVPQEPSRDEVQTALHLLLHEWLGDLPLHEQADRANLLALVLTPYIRGLVPLVPLAVIDGLMMGVGKNLTADCIALLCTGASADPLPFPNDNDELRKVITSTFGTGAELFVFDEAHVLQGTSLSRALTAITYSDRILGVSRMARYPNTVTWIALGNQVQVCGDMARRIYRIALRPVEANPERRKATQFRHPDLRAWTREHRTELVQAALTLVRAWFSAGQPSAPKAASFGSFETWERIVGGILHHAGVVGFLDNLSSWRVESDYDTGYWTDHLHDLWVQFGDDRFTVREVVDAMNSGGITEMPPDLYSFTGPEYHRSLGRAYSRVKDRWFGRYRLVISGLAGNGGARGRVNTWRIEDLEDLPTIPPGWEGSEGSEGSAGAPATSARLSAPGAPAPAPVDLFGDPHAQRRTDPSRPSDPSVALAAADPPLDLDIATDALVREEKGQTIAAGMTQRGLRVDTELLHGRVRSLRSERFQLVQELTNWFGFPAGKSDGSTAVCPWLSEAGTQRLAALTQGTTWPAVQGRARLDVPSLRVVQRTDADPYIRRLAELISTLQTWPDFEASLEKHTVRGRVHPRYSSDTATGRWMATGPNILGVGRRTPRLLAQRDLILAEPDEVLVGMDLEGIDARAVAGLSGDPDYAELFQRRVDIHAHVSAVFFGNPGHREAAKAITHGLAYGQGAESLSVKLGRQKLDVQALIARFFEEFPRIRSWQDEVRGAALMGSVPTGTGRVVPVEPERLWTQAPARAAQAAARDIALVGLIRLSEAGLGPCIRLFVHDEVILSVPRDEAVALTEQARTLMSFPWKSPSGLVIPITAKAHEFSGTRWSDLYGAAM